MIRRVLIAKSLRAFADGYVSVLLPAYLLALGHGQLDVGILSTATLLGSALATWTAHATAAMIDGSSRAQIGFIMFGFREAQLLPRTFAPRAARR